MLENDNRNFIKIYWEYILIYNFILNLIIYDDILSMKIIKIYFLLFCFIFLKFLNTFFYFDNYIIKIYKSKNSNNFIYNLPKIFYSFLILLFFIVLFVKIFLNKNSIKNVIKKHIKNPFNFEEKLDKKLKKIKIKNITFFIITFLLEILFLYYITIFGEIYKNNKKEILLSSIYSILLIIILPFFYCLILSLLKYYSIKNKNEILYKINIILYI